jgi:hypothetical protein
VYLAKNSISFTNPKKRLWGGGRGNGNSDKDDLGILRQRMGCVRCGTTEVTHITGCQCLYCEACIRAIKDRRGYCFKCPILKPSIKEASISDVLYALRCHVDSMSKRAQSSSSRLRDFVRTLCSSV